MHLEWSPNDFLGSDLFDVDLSVFLLNEEGKVEKEQDFIFYNNLSDSQEAVLHMGDNLEQQNGLMKEDVKIHLEDIEEQIKRVAGVVSINIEDKDINFGQIANAHLYVKNIMTNEIIVSYDLTEDFSFENSILMCEFEKDEEGWIFKSIIQSYNSLAEISESFGLNVK